MRVVWRIPLLRSHEAGAHRAPGGKSSDVATGEKQGHPVAGKSNPTLTSACLEQHDHSLDFTDPRGVPEMRGSTAHTCIRWP